MGKFIDLTGKRFGRLTVIKRIDNNKFNQIRYLCQCDCGNKTIVIGCNLKSGHTQSCGCIMKGSCAKRAFKMGKKYGYISGIKNRKYPNLPYNKTQLRLNRIWLNIIKRCNDKSNKNYGGKGIKICNEWLNNFENFYNWAIANGYQDNLTIDRIDNNKGYSPDNCRWATKKEQARNMTTNRLITHNGETHCMIEWSEILNIPYRKFQDMVYKNQKIF